MLSSFFWVTFSSSFWIIPREGTEALLVIIMLCTALKQSGRSEHLSVIYKSCGLAILAGSLLAVGCIELQSIFTGKYRELSEAISSVIALSMLLYVNFSIFSGFNKLESKTLFGLSFMAFISVFRELAEVVLFYIALFQGNYEQKLGTLSGLVAGSILLFLLILSYNISTDKWKKFNRLIFDLTPFFMFILSLMCIGNAINSFQEAGVLGFTPVKWMINSNLFHIQASKEYLISLIAFIACCGPLFAKQFINSFNKVLLKNLVNLFPDIKLSQKKIQC